MIKRMISGCLVFAFCFFVRNVNAASTCDYKDQVELSNVASTIKTGYEIKKVVMDENENILDADPDSVLFGSDFFIVSTLHGYVHNLTQDVYVKITNDEGFAFVSLLPLGNYYLKELQTDSQYLLDSNTYPITLSYIDENTPIVKMKIQLINYFVPKTKKDSFLFPLLILIGGVCFYEKKYFFTSFTVN